MAASRLSDSQKAELVERFRRGASTQALAEAYGCSPNTVIRAAKTALEPALYEELKQKRARRVSGSAPASQEPSPAPLPAVAAQEPAETVQQPAGPARQPSGEVTGTLPGGDDEDTDEDREDGPGVLAIDDADDFSLDSDEDDEIDDDSEEGDDEGEGDPGDPDDGHQFHTVPLALNLEVDAVRQPTPLASATFPSSVYMLVDKSVELQARPLSEFPELGQLPEEERERQALMVFINPRQAKRQCGRSQRVIKLPDPGLLERTAPYLLAQGISRVVIEGALYALPGS